MSHKTVSCVTVLYHRRSISPSRLKSATPRTLQSPLTSRLCSLMMLEKDIPQRVVSPVVGLNQSRSFPPSSPRSGIGVGGLQSRLVRRVRHPSICVPFIHQMDLSPIDAAY